MKTKINTDKERILSAIIKELSSTNSLGPGNNAWCSEKYNFSGIKLLHFAPWLSNKLEKGMLVLCQTSLLNDYSIGFVHHVFNNSNCVIREIGSDKLCNIGNERFIPIIGWENNNAFLEGEKYQFFIKVRKAFQKKNDISYVYGGLEFYDDMKARIFIRERYGGILKGNGSTNPIPVDIEWDKKTTIKHIIQRIETAWGNVQNSLKS